MAESDELLPLSLEQAALFKDHKLRSWQFPMRFPLPVSVDDGALAQAIALVAARHEPLRLRLRRHDGGIAQTVRPPAEVPPLNVVQLPPGPATRDVAEEVHRTSRDLYGAGPFRATLVRHGAGAELLVAVHHLAWDDRSLELFMSELMVAYQALIAGRPPRLAPLRTSWTEHVRHQAAAGKQLPEAEVAYWSEQLGKSVSLRPPGGGELGGGWSAVTPGPALSAEQHAAVSRFARDIHVTPATVWLVLLQRGDARASGHDDFVYYLMHHGRDRRGAESLIGFFARNLVLRHQASADLAGQCRAALLSVSRGIERSGPPYTISRLARQMDPALFGDGGFARPMSSLTISLRNVEANPAGDEAPPPAGPVAARPARLWFWGAVGRRTELRAEFDRRLFPESFVTTVFDDVATSVEALRHG
jgi:hypothetical protein